MILTASQLRTLLSVLYILVVDYKKNGERKADRESASQIRAAMNSARSWTTLLPGLPEAMKSAVSGTGKLQSLVNLGFEIKESFQKFRSDREFTGTELDTLSALGMYLRTDSESAMAKLIRLASVSENPWVVQELRPKAINQKSVEPELKKLVKKMVGRAGTLLTLEESTLAKSTYPDEYKEYLALRRVFNQAWKNALTDFVRSSGLNKVPYQDLLSALDAANVTYSLSKGFTGLVDDQGRLYTKRGDAIAGVPSAANFPTVVMNPDYPKTQWVFQSIRPNGEAGQYFYTEKFRQAQSQRKFAAVEKLTSKMPAIRRKWNSMVKSFDVNNAVNVAAVILELLYLFSARVGTQGNSTFGIATLQVRHLKEMPNGIVITYKGKDGVPHKHVLNASDSEHRPVIEALQELVAGKELKDRVFSVGRKPVNPNIANALFKQLSGMPDVTVHKIRTLRGTALLRQIMDREMPKIKARQERSGMSEKQALDIFKGMAEKVGKLLNHVRRGASGTKVTGMTAIQSYIDPSLSVAFFEELGIRPPRMLERAEV